MGATKKKEGPSPSRSSPFLSQPPDPRLPFALGVTWFVDDKDYPRFP